MVNLSIIDGVYVGMNMLHHYVYRKEDRGWLAGGVNYGPGGCP
jgi:hypothetical protein